MSIWNLVYTSSRQCHTSSQSFITVGSPWPTLQPRMGQCNFLHLWHQKLYRAFRFSTLWPISCSYPRHSQLTRHSLMLANGRIRQSLTALVCCSRMRRLHTIIYMARYSQLMQHGGCRCRVYYIIYLAPAHLQPSWWGSSVGAYPEYRNLFCTVEVWEWTNIK